MKKLFLILFIIILTTVGIFIYYKESSKKKETLITERVKRGDLFITVETDGVIVAKKRVDIRSKIQGRIKNIFVDEGDKVKNGDLIAKIDPAEFQARYEQQEANLQMAEANLKKIKLISSLQETEYKNKIEQTEKMLQQAKLKLQDAERNLDRVKQLNDRNLISQSEIDEAKVSYDLLKSKYEEIDVNLKSIIKSFNLNRRSNEEEIKLATARVNNAKAQLKFAKENLNWTNIISPISGIITYRGVELGEMIAPEQWGKASGTIIATVSDLSSLFVETNVNEVDIGMVKLGQDVEISVDAYPDYEIKGEIKKIGLQALNQKGTGTSNFFVKIKILNPKDVLKPGMNCSVKILVAHLKKTIYIPVETVIREGKREFVKVKVGDKILKRYINTGLSNINFVQVISGLKEGEEIVIPLSEVKKKE